MVHLHQNDQSSLTSTLYTSRPSHTQQQQQQRRHRAQDKPQCPSEEKT